MWSVEQLDSLYFKIAPAESMIGENPVEAKKEQPKTKSTYSYRLSDEIALWWKAYAEAKGKKIGELTEAAILSYMQNCPLSTPEQKIYDLELMKNVERTMR